MDEWSRYDWLDEGRAEMVHGRGWPASFNVVNLDKAKSRFKWWTHNVLAHPLLVLCPPAGRWLHDRTEPED